MLLDAEPMALILINAAMMVVLVGAVLLLSALLFVAVRIRRAAGPQLAQSHAELHRSRMVTTAANERMARTADTAKAVERGAQGDAERLALLIAKARVRSQGDYPAEGGM